MRLSYYAHGIRLLRNCRDEHTTYGLWTGIEVSLQTLCGLWTVKLFFIAGKSIYALTSSPLSDGSVGPPA